MEAHSGTFVATIAVTAAVRYGSRIRTRLSSYETVTQDGFQEVVDGPAVAAGHVKAHEVIRCCKVRCMFQPDICVIRQTSRLQIVTTIWIEVDVTHRTKYTPVNKEVVTHGVDDIYEVGYRRVDACTVVIVLKPRPGRVQTCHSADLLTGPHPDMATDVSTQAKANAPHVTETRPVLYQVINHVSRISSNCSGR